MKELTFASTLPAAKKKKVLKYIKQICDLHLAPRTLVELEQKIDKQNILMAFIKDEIAGWALIEIYNSQTQEIGGAYVKPAYRRQGIFSQIIKSATERRPISIISTYSDLSSASPAKRIGFRSVSFWTILKKAGPKYITTRLSASRIKAIFRHAKKAKTQYLIYESV